MRTKLTSLALAAIMTLAAARMAYTDTVGGPLHAEAAYQQRFADVPEHHWAVTYIEEMAENGILAGYPDGNFYPDKKITRAEFAKIMTVAAGMNINMSDTATIFEDVSADDWFAPYVKRAQYYLSGYTTIMVEGSTYRPNQLALREDITVAMVKLKGYSVDGVDDSTLQTLITDSNSVSSDAKKYVVVAIQRGLISGYEDGTFRGQSSITRAEAAAIMWRAFQYGNDNKLFDYNTPNPTASPMPTPTRRPTTLPTVRPIAEEPLIPTERPTARPRPTVRPVAEEPLIPTQKPTPRPTAKPTATPEPTPSPEPERPYVMDTIKNANMGIYRTNYTSYMTYDNSDNIYYYDTGDDIVYKIDMNRERVSELLYLDELTMREDGTFDHEEPLATPQPESEQEETEYHIEHYLDFNLVRLYYDKENERLLLRGYFQNITDWQQPGKKFRESSDTIWIDITDIGKPVKYTGAVSSFNDWEPHASTEYDEYRIYGSASGSNGYLQKYDYNSRQWKRISERNLPYFNVHALSTDGDLYYFWNVVDGNMFTCELNGVVKNWGVQSTQDIGILDKTDYPDRNYVDCFHVCRNGKVIFYDSAADAIRVLKAR
ncbi:MAG TPA: S-layer homology domain-containing protein [Candidatus Ornithomonoglobus intestinigallinarum]|uniref:S-layer homology domain-containing protein n=1 Tax=Candidatus Ornithomonoglobus intestinigallinarum TaxID=2840894 RepID=A0A9D1KPD4_9FIRM|nr:S-layer homology domain-containing protein [Candidatus Ornithomonoglobus intestinigallinarum]